MFGYACEDTAELMPLPIWLAHRLAERLTEVRKSGELPYLRPDGKTQVTIDYDGDRAVRLDTVVVSTQHAADISLDGLLPPDIADHVVKPVLDALAESSDIDTSDYRLLVNPTGRFEIGGPMGDAGLTGRKIIVDTYGGMARHGGGAFSGKDPSKVDRSAAYAMRWVAKNVVAAGLAARCEVAGRLRDRQGPAGRSLRRDLRHRARRRGPDHPAIGQVFDLRPAAIVADLDLLRPIYAQTAAYGHFGRWAAGPSPGSGPTGSTRSRPLPGSELRGSTSKGAEDDAPVRRRAGSCSRVSFRGDVAAIDAGLRLIRRKVASIALVAATKVTR